MMNIIHQLTPKSPKLLQYTTMFSVMNGKLIKLMIKLEFQGFCTEDIKEIVMVEAILGS